jgi:hypothetical protein
MRSYRVSILYSIYLNNCNQSARTFSTLSDKIYDSYIDLTEEPEELEKPEKPEEEEEREE